MWIVFLVRFILQLKSWPLLKTWIKLLVPLFPWCTDTCTGKRCEVGGNICVSIQSFGAPHSLEEQKEQLRGSLLKLQPPFTFLIQHIFIYFSAEAVKIRMCLTFKGKSIHSLWRRSFFLLSDVQSGCRAVKHGCCCGWSLSVCSWILPDAALRLSHFSFGLTDGLVSISKCGAWFHLAAFPFISVSFPTVSSMCHTVR